jgi:transcriptional regulator with XRE-family HTH domain
VNIKLAENLRFLRKQRKLNQTDMADQIGFTRTAYARYEQGTGEPSIETLWQLADFFEMSIDELVGRKSTDLDRQILAVELERYVDQATRKAAEDIKYEVQERIRRKMGD